MSRKRRSPRPLRFNLTQRDHGYQGGSSAALLVGGVLFCGALAFFFKNPEPRAASGHGASAQATALAAGEDLDYRPPTPATLRTAAVPRPGADFWASQQVRFSLCGKVRHDCVVDGDTFWAQGKKIRIADIDTPEISRPRCREEHALGVRATMRLLELLNEGPFDLVQPADGRDRDQYGRALRDVRRGGVSIGDQLVAEGLARKWEGRRKPWC